MTSGKEIFCAVAPVHLGPWSASECPGVPPGAIWVHLLRLEQRITRLYVDELPRYDHELWGTSASDHGGETRTSTPPRLCSRCGAKRVPARPNVRSRAHACPARNAGRPTAAAYPPK